MNRTEFKLFERMPQFSEWTLLVGERMQKPFKQMSKPFKQTSQPFEWFVEHFEWIFLGVWMDDEQITNGLPLQTDNH